MSVTPYFDYLTGTPGNPFMTAVYQNIMGSGVAYEAVKSTRAPFYDVAFGGQNPTLMNAMKPTNTLLENFYATPAQAFLSAQQVMQQAGPMAIESPAVGSVDTYVLDTTVAGPSTSIPLPQGDYFTGAQSVLNLTTSVQSIPAALGSAMPNLTMTTSLMPERATETMRYAPLSSAPIIYNSRSANLQLVQNAYLRSRAVEQGGVTFTSVE